MPHLTKNIRFDAQKQNENELLAFALSGNDMK